MAFSGGTFSRTFDCTTDRDNGVKILASKFDTELDGMATGLSTCILKDGTQTCTAAIPFAEGLTVPDNKTIVLGTNSDITIQYDESTNDSLEIAANVEGAALGIVLKADQGDDNADQHKVNIADGGTLTMASKISGSFVSYLTHTPNSTVADSTTAVAGNLTVGGDLTLGSGAVISEAELEKLDGITNGTVAADKAVVVDSNKDIASFRNITLTGELDAGSLDVSGDADIDGTLEADAITVNGTALNTVIAGVTVTDATNSAHVLVTDNESTNEENLITFVEDATSSTGNVGLEMDGNLTYNPSTGTVTATVFKGNIDAVDGDFDGTLEADAMTLNGTAITATATLDTGISNNNVPKFTSGVADNDFLRVDGTAIEGRSASEVLSDIAAAPAAGDSNIVTTGALNSGSITSGFGAIDNGSSNITTTGVGTFGSLDISGDIDVDGTTNLDAVDIDGNVDIATTATLTCGAITSSISDHTNLTLTSTNADANAGPKIVLNRDSGSPADGDATGQIIFKADDDAGNSTEFAKIESSIIDAGDGSGGSEDGRLIFRTITAGTATSRLDFTNTETVFNDSSIDVDFRVESNGDANLLKVDAGNDVLGIGAASPDTTFRTSIHGDGSSIIGGILFRNASSGGETFTIGHVNATSSSAHINVVPAANLIFSTSNTQRMRLNSSGALGIGTNSPGAFLDVNNASATSATLMVLKDSGGTGAHTQISFQNTNGQVGNITTTDNSTAFNTSSDYRLKENVDYTWDATTRFKQLKPARFNFISNADTTVDGFLAHEVSSIVPEAITGTKDETRSVSNAVLSSTGELLAEGITQDEWTAGKDDAYPSDSTWTASHTEPVMQGIDQSKLVPLLVKTIQELEARITALEAG